MLPDFYAKVILFGETNFKWSEFCTFVKNKEELKH